MKQLLFLFSLTLLFAGCQSATTEEGGDDAADASPEMAAFEAQQENFHTVMAATFHPAEEGNVEPLREKAGDLTAAAKTWSNLQLPAEYDDTDLNSRLAELVRGSERIEGLIQTEATDSTLQQAITNLHEVFHGIMGECKHAEEHHME